MAGAKELYQNLMSFDLFTWFAFAPEVRLALLFTQFHLNEWTVLNNVCLKHEQENDNCLLLNVKINNR